jgi:predicted branched-subunit amino acid permease
MPSADAPPTERQKVIRDAVGIGLATGAYGISFGAVSTATGLDIIQTCALSLLMFTGASQFALVGVIDGGGSALAGAATAGLLGTRNGLYGLRLSSILRLSWLRKVFGAQWVIDETTAMAVAQKEPALSRLSFWATGTAIYICWNSGTLIGALGTEALSNPKNLGLDAAIPAAFIALLAPMLRSGKMWAVTIVAGLTGLAVTPMVQSGIPVLCAAIVASIVALVIRAEPEEGPVE